MLFAFRRRPFSGVLCVVYCLIFSLSLAGCPTGLMGPREGFAPRLPSTNKVAVFFRQSQFGNIDPRYFRKYEAGEKIVENAILSELIRKGFDPINLGRSPSVEYALDSADIIFMRDYAGSNAFRHYYEEAKSERSRLLESARREDASSLLIVALRVARAGAPMSKDNITFFDVQRTEFLGGTVGWFDLEGNFIHWKNMGGPLGWYPDQQDANARSTVVIASVSGTTGRFVEMPEQAWAANVAKAVLREVPRWPGSHARLEPK